MRPQWKYIVFIAIPACVPSPGGQGDTAGLGDGDGDGVLTPEDCDDGNASIYPGAPERCDGLDNDCDALVDDEDELALDEGILYFQDGDGDGYGDPSSARRMCTRGDGLVSDDTDCDDVAADSNPGATEICDGIDNDCDGLIDDRDDSLDASAGETGFVDADGDGHGDPARPVQACVVGPESGTSGIGDDCDDGEREAAPGNEEICGDGIDNDCSGDAIGCGFLKVADTQESDFTITMSEAIGASLGTVAIVIDDDGDGYDDLIITAPAYREDSTAEVTPLRLWIPGPLTEGQMGVPDDMTSSSEATFDSLAASTEGRAAGDLDGDGFEDSALAMVVGWSGGEAWIRQGGGDGAVRSLIADQGLTVHPLGDLDGDGFADLAVGTPRDSSWYGEVPRASTGGVHLLFGHEGLFDDLSDIAVADGVSVLGEVAPVTFRSWTPGTVGSVATLDFNGDGHRDLLIGAPSPYASSVGTLAVMEGPHGPSDADHVYTDAVDVAWEGTSSSGGMGAAVAAGDLDGDGYDDVVGGEDIAGGLTYVFHGSASDAGTHDAWSRRDLLITGSEDGGEGHLGVHRSIRDLDADGTLDLLLLDNRSPYSERSGAFGFLDLSEAATLGHEDATLRLVSQSATGSCAFGPVVFGDLNADGVEDLVLSCVSEPLGGQVHLFFGALN